MRNAKNTQHPRPLTQLLVVPALAIGVMALPLLSPQPAQAQSCCKSDDQSVLNLSAYGEVKQAPDMATVSAGVQTDALTAEEAMRQNRTQMNQVFRALERLGIADKDIQTSNLTLSPQWQHSNNQRPRVVGYRAANTVTVIVRDLTKVGPAIDAVVGAGSNSLHGVNFALSNPEEALNEARREAAKALREKAQLYAQAMGYRLGRIIRLNEQGGNSPAPQYKAARAMMAEASMDAPTPVAPGEMTMRISLSGQFELLR